MSTLATFLPQAAVPYAFALLGATIVALMFSFVATGVLTLCELSLSTRRAWDRFGFWAMVAGGVGAGVGIWASVFRAILQAV